MWREVGLGLASRPAVPPTWPLPRVQGANLLSNALLTAVGLDEALALVHERGLPGPAKHLENQLPPQIPPS